MSLFYQFVENELEKVFYPAYDQEGFDAKKQAVKSFLSIPFEFEKFIFFGLIQCLDIFLYIFTLMPIRCLSSIKRLLMQRRQLDAADRNDLFKMFIILLTSCFLSRIDLNVLYHLIRSQNVIKLFIFFNMLEVGDKLFCSIGSDIIDTAIWSCVEGRYVSFDHLVMILYMFMHSFLVLLQATVLHVAFNSHSAELFTIMMSNNFIEIKTNVFRVFNKDTHFTLACWDVRERFHLAILLAVVSIRNLSDVGWKITHLRNLLPFILIAFAVECVVDWIKHSFVTRVSSLSHTNYFSFKCRLALDLINSRQRRAASDHSDIVSRKMSFLPLALAALLLRTIVPVVHVDIPNVIIFVLFFVCLILTKLVTSVYIVGKSCVYLDQIVSPVHVHDIASEVKSPLRGRSKSTVDQIKLDIKRDF